MKVDIAFESTDQYGYCIYEYSRLLCRFDSGKVLQLRPNCMYEKSLKDFFLPVDKWNQPLF